MRARRCGGDHAECDGAPRDSAQGMPRQAESPVGAKVPAGGGHAEALQTQTYPWRVVVTGRAHSSIEGLRDMYLSQTPTRLPRSFTTAVGTRQSPQNGDNGD